MIIYCSTTKWRKRHSMKIILEWQVRTQKSINWFGTKQNKIKQLSKNIYYLQTTICNYEYILKCKCLLPEDQLFITYNKDTQLTFVIELVMCILDLKCLLEMLI